MEQQKIKIQWLYWRRVNFSYWNNKNSHIYRKPNHNYRSSARESLMRKNKPLDLGGMMRISPRLDSIKVKIYMHIAQSINEFIQHGDVSRVHPSMIKKKSHSIMIENVTIKSHWIIIAYLSMHCCSYWIIPPDKPVQFPAQFCKVDLPCISSASLVHIQFVWM